MKHLLLILLAIPLLASCQKYDIEADAICWKTNGVDSNLVRLTQITSLGATRIIGYVNTSGVTVTPADGELLYGVCECCNPSVDTLTQIISFSAAQPTLNPFNPSVCNSSMTATVESTVDELHVTVELNGNPITFDFFPSETPRRVYAFLPSSTGAGISTVTMTITNSLGSETETRTFDCGGS